MPESMVTPVAPRGPDRRDGLEVERDLVGQAGSAPDRECPVERIADRPVTRRILAGHLQDGAARRRRVQCGYVHK
jgi:hypothetical protein